MNIPGIIGNFLRIMSDTLVVGHSFTQPSSAAAEQVFSLLSNSENIPGIIGNFLE